MKLGRIIVLGGFTQRQPTCFSKLLSAFVLGQHSPASLCISSHSPTNPSLRGFSPSRSQGWGWLGRGCKGWNSLGPVCGAGLAPRPFPPHRLLHPAVSPTSLGRQTSCCFLRKSLTRVGARGRTCKMTRGGRMSAGLAGLKKMEQEEEGRNFYAGLNTFSCSCLKTSTWILLDIFLLKYWRRT